MERGGGGHVPLDNMIRMLVCVFLCLCMSINKNWNVDDCRFKRKVKQCYRYPLKRSIFCSLSNQTGQKKGFDYTWIIYKLSIKILFSSEGISYKNWMKNDAEQTASLCIVIHGLIAIFWLYLLVCTCAWERCRVVTVLCCCNLGCKSRSNQAGHGFLIWSFRKGDASAVLVGGRSGWTCGWTSAEECRLSQSACPFYETIAIKLG